MDHALVRSTSTGILVNDGHLLENLVFVDRRRRGNEVYYYRTRSGREVDFVWRGGDGRLTLAQVCFRAAEGSETLARELTALREALEEQPGSRAVLVTMDDEHRHVKTASGIVFELRYIRDTQKREVDFVVIRNGNPWVLVEAKHGGAGLSPHLAFFQKQTGARHAFQISMRNHLARADLPMPGQIRFRPP